MNYKIYEDELVKGDRCINCKHWVYKDKGVFMETTHECLAGGDIEWMLARTTEKCDLWEAR